MSGGGGSSFQDELQEHQEDLKTDTETTLESIKNNTILAASGIDELLNKVENYTQEDTWKYEGVEEQFEAINKAPRRRNREKERAI